MKKEKSKVAESSVVYIGPTITNVAKANTVYQSGKIPKDLESFFVDYPLAKNLIVNVEELASAQEKLKTTGSLFEVSYRKTKEYLSKKGV